jgi:hypothetical protein
MVIGLLPSKGYQEIDDRGNTIFIILRIAIFKRNLYSPRQLPEKL